MADKFVSERNLKFLLYEVFDAAVAHPVSLLRRPQPGDLRHGPGDGHEDREEPAEAEALRRWTRSLRNSRTGRSTSTPWSGPS